VEFYVRRKSDGEISVAATVNYGIDTTDPQIAQVEYTRNIARSFLNALTFRMFFRDTVDVTLTAQDAPSGPGSGQGSGVEKIEYYIATSAVYDTGAISSWTLYQNPFTLEQRNSYILYVRVTDKAGNTSISYEGVVVFTASAASASGVYTQESGENLIIPVAMYGNTVSEITTTVGTTATTLTRDVNYTVNYYNDTITFIAYYLDGFDVDEFTALAQTFNVSWLPRGVENAPLDETGVVHDTIPETEIIITISHVPTYGISLANGATPLTASDTHIFDAADYGYPDQSALDVTVTNICNPPGR
jgi:hypothetical protein